MKALSIKEPWATMFIKGKKTIETRVWSTKYRGDLLLCASKKPVSKISGHAFAVAKLIGCEPMTKLDEKLACCEVYDGAWSWFLIDVTLIKPLLVKGQLGLFEVDTKGLIQYV
jgi:hypothetical protein